VARTIDEVVLIGPLTLGPLHRELHQRIVWELILDDLNSQWIVGARERIGMYVCNLPRDLLREVL
jgi:hypothetical protein